jgi:hypothetical protein
MFNNDFINVCNMAGVKPDAIYKVKLAFLDLLVKAALAERIPCAL